MIGTTATQLAILFTLTVLLFPQSINAAVLTSNTTWEGTIELADDLLVPTGITLTIKPGTTVLISTAESTKTEPEYLSPLTELTVRGNLSALGTPEKPIRFLAKERQHPGSWAGILVDGGQITLSNTSVSAADTGIHLYSGSARLQDCTLSGNYNGAVVIGSASLFSLQQSAITGNDYGLVLLGEPRIERIAVTITANRKANEQNGNYGAFAAPPLAPLPALPIAKQIGDTALLGDTLWSGRIIVSGQVRVPEGSRLLIAPGSIIEFRRLDTNGDSLGESGILIQGVLIAKGTAAQPITFRSAEAARKPGDWDSINIMNSDGVRNLVEHCRFEDAYRGLHFHFSQVLVANSTFRNNYRGIQFQESSVEILDSRFSANRSGVQGRDSRVRFSNNQLIGNYTGVNFLRCVLSFNNNALLANLREGGRIREGTARVERNQAIGNRIGLQLADLFRGSITNNDLAGNTDFGLAMKNIDNLEVSGNHLGSNGINGLNMQDVRATVRNNLLTGNRQRGIGIISFSGMISDNSFADNGLYAIENEGSEDIDAQGNWWGGSPPRSVILDGTTDPRRGKVLVSNLLSSAPNFTWPIPQIDAATVWSGHISLLERTTVHRHAILAVRPGTVVTFAPAAGLTVNGKLLANGTVDKRITFTALNKQAAESWDEILLENALDSQFTFTNIEYATWGIHSHFTNLLVSDVSLRHNYGGMRFRSGPVLIRRVLATDNTIGIRSYIGMGAVTDSVISDNDIGIFIREKGGSLAIHRNTIAGNHNYNLRVGDFNTEDVQAQHNWWGDDDPGETIFDSRQEPGIGRVMYEPYLTRPLIEGGAPK
jgi:nitrous oxidase accessory protein NosD